MTAEVDGTTEELPYETLYNKYRPHRFSELIGQDQTASALRRAVAAKKTSHAYLFSGPRGTGKTTSARVFAAALNCPFVEDGEPCTECDICQSTFSGTFSGTVNELNATNQRGIDDVRQLLSSVDMGVAANYKVYIIDEVHQLTKEASSLLLKTLEEPPSSSVRFVLATTDPEKLLDTIRSRVVNMQFRLLSNDHLQGLVEEIVEKEGIEASKGDILNTVSTGRGSARDTLSALERVVMGLSNDDMNILDEVLQGILDKNLATILLSLAKADAAGALNARNVAEDIMTFWRDALVYQQNPDLVIASKERMTIIKSCAKDMQRKEIIRNFETTASALSTMRTAGSNRIALEGGIARMLTPMPSNRNFDLLFDKLAEIQDQLASGASVSSQNSQGSPWSGDNEKDENWPDKEEEAESESEPEEQKAERPRRSRRGTKRRSSTSRTRRSSTKVDEPEDQDEQQDESPEEPEEPEQTEETQEETSPEHDELYAQALDAVSGRGKILIEEGSYGSNEDGVFTIYTERRVVARSQEKIIEALGVEVSFEVKETEE